MDFTGERYVPSLGGEIRQEHVHRYAYAATFVAGKYVLDAACGEGYGSELLSRHAGHVLGVDIASEAVDHARSIYGSRPNLEFLLGSVLELPVASASIDVVVSFETIEHLAEHDEMLGEMRRVLRPDGLLILSSPNKTVYSDEANYANPHHVKELYFEQLDALVRGQFRHLAYLGQRFATASTIYPLQTETARRGSPRIGVWADDGVAPVARLPRLTSPKYFLLLATNADALPKPAATMLLSETDDLFNEQTRIARWASGVHHELVAAQAGARETETVLQARLEASTTQLKMLTDAVPAGEVAALRAELEAAVAALNAAEIEATRRQAQHAEQLAAEQARLQHEIQRGAAAAEAQGQAHELQLRQLAQSLAEAESATRQVEADWRLRAEIAEARIEGELVGHRSAVAQVRLELRAESQKGQALSAAAQNMRDGLLAQLAGAEARERELRDETRRQLQLASDATHAQRLEWLSLLESQQSDAAQQASAAARALAEAADQTDIRLRATELQWRGRLARARLEMRRLEQAARAAASEWKQRLALSEQDHQQRLTDVAAQALALRAELASERQAWLAQLARLTQERQSMEVDGERRHEAWVVEQARHRGAWQAEIASLAEASQSREAQAQLREAEHARERVAWQGHLAKLSYQAEQRDAAAAAGTAQQHAEHASERLRWQRQLLAEQQAHHHREATLQAGQAAQQAEHVAAEQTASQRLAAAEARAHQASEAARLREENLQTLLQQCTQLAALLGRELLSVYSSLGWRMWSPFRAASRRLSPAELRSTEGKLRALASGAARYVHIPELLPATGQLEIKSLHATPMNMPLTVATAQTVDDLLNLDDLQFLQAAYPALLGRAADADGLTHYLGALAGGRSRLQVLADLRFSKEGSSRVPGLPGLDEALREMRLRRIPLLGRLLRKRRTPELVVVRQDLSTLTVQMRGIDDRIHERLQGVEHSVQVGVQGLAQHALSADARIDIRMRAIETAVQAAVHELTTRVQQTDSHLEARLSRIEHALQAAARGDDERAKHTDTQLAQRLGSVEEALHSGLPAQTAVITQALARCQWPPETDLWRMAHTLLSTEPEPFVHSLFAMGLGREPHDYEIRHFLARMNQGASRIMLVEKLLQSPEFTQRHPPLVPAAVASAEPSSPAAPVQASAVAWSEALPSVPIHANPVVSVVIPVYGQLDYTLRCLRSIARHAPQVPFEVIVVNDCSLDDSATVLAQVPGIRLVHNAQNQGFIRSCNHGASIARGAYLCMLNNDTEVAARWLDELHGTFELFPGTGLVGSKLLYPDGALQEAGGILWRDGSAWNFGHRQDAALPGFNYAREVDYCSGASIMVPTALYRQLGGFDEHYLPAYCEDSDLALKIRQLGLRVLYQPLSSVVHHEGVTSGTDTGGGVKAYQVVNSQKLYARWHQRLGEHQRNGLDVDHAKDRMATRRVLVLDIVTPTPNHDAGSVTVVNLLTLLREMRFQVTFVAQDNFLYLPEHTPPLQRNGVEVLYAPYVTSVEQHLAECGDRYDMVLIWRPTVVEKHLATVRRLCPRAKVLYHTVDLHYLRMEREARLEGDAGKLAAAGDMKALELRAVQGVDCAIVHSTHELEVLKGEIPVQNVFVFPLIVDVPGSKAPFASRSGIAFVGGYQHPPNIDAARYFVREVMPLLRTRLPGLRFHVIGSNAPQEVLDLASSDVVVEGFVHELQPLLDRMRLSVAPLRYGAGIKGKVGNSMAMGLPVVATGMAVEGMGLADRQHLLIADGETALADAVCELYNDEPLWQHLQAQGLKRVDELSGATASYNNLRQLLEGLGFDVEPPAHALRLYRDARS